MEKSIKILLRAIGISIIVLIIVILKNNTDIKKEKEQNNEINKTSSSAINNIVQNSKNEKNVINKVENEVITNENGEKLDTKYSQSRLEELAIDYYQSKTGERTEYVASEIAEDGVTLAIQLYDIFNGHNSTADWYKVDMNTAKGTNSQGEEINLNE